MTTIDEFNKITQSMYDKGYVMVSLHDMCTVNEDGTVSPGKIMLPPGKKAFVLSQDDVSYYHYMDGDGMATKLIVDENGDIKNEYKEDDGSISVGDYDMVPLIDRFVEEHPDFSYHGHKGIIALTDTTVYSVIAPISHTRQEKTWMSTRRNSSKRTRISTKQPGKRKDSRRKKWQMP